MFNLVLADKLLDLACNLVDRDYKTPALHRIFSTLYDKQTEFHVLGPIDRLKSKQKSSCFDGPTNQSINAAHQQTRIKRIQRCKQWHCFSSLFVISKDKPTGSITHVFIKRFYIFLNRFQCQTSSFS